MNFLLVAKDVIRVDGLYAHGKAAQLCDKHNKPGDFMAPDMIGLEGEFPDLAEGTHACMLHGEPATLFYWKGRVIPHRGMVVLNTDAKGLAYGRKTLAAHPEFF